MDQASEFLNALNSHFFNANKRLFWGYLLTTLLLVALVWFRQKRHVPFLKFLFPKKVWLHPSAKIDYSVWLINNLVKILVILPLLFSAAPIAIWLSQSMEAVFGDIPNVTHNRTIILVSFTLLVFLLDDFSRFFLHWIMHKVPLLWSLHKVHHSAEVLTPFTVYRLHPLESALYACRLVLSQGFAIGIGFYLFGHKLALYDILGANVFVFLFNLFGSNLRHSHVWLSWGDRIENWFISPAQHQIHHSNSHAHYDKNLGAALSIWDRLFGTFLPASSVTTPLKFGVGEQPHGKLTALYLRPLFDMYNNLKNGFKSGNTASKQVHKEG